jgi:hypothetical protein
VTLDSQGGTEWANSLSNWSRELNLFPGVNVEAAGIAESANTKSTKAESVNTESANAENQ